jgi:Anaerobic dehydrogenases, typically selenocysteine-containing
MSNAELQRQAKIANAQTGIEIKKTMCEVCSRGCGVDAYVSQGVIVKLEGTEGDPTGYGKLCQKGQAGRQYIYRPDRIKTPLKRIGRRGSGEFIPITWEEAYGQIAEKLNGYKTDFGADSVVFYSGYTKWYRPFFHRLAFSFGSINFGSESSACFYAALMANILNTGGMTRPDIRNSGVFLGWAYNRYYSGSVSETKRLEQYKQNGLKIIIIDPRVTPAVMKLADMHLQPIPGTDGALAHAFARIFIKAKYIDEDFIKLHVYGFEEYAEYVEQFDTQTVSRITGIAEADIYAAARLIMENGPMSINESGSPLLHHINGLQSYRAIMALSAITGNFDKPGGQIPLRFADSAWEGDRVIDQFFVISAYPYKSKPKIGAVRFPVWSELVYEFQSMDMARHILEQKPYPLKAVLALGMNYRMFPDDMKVLQALQAVDFFVDVDIFLTDTAQYADIVLPACTSYERGTFRDYGNGNVAFSQPVIAPLFESKSDADIICELARALDLDDQLLKAGYEECCRYLLSQAGLSPEELKQSHRQIRIPGFTNYTIGKNTQIGYMTPSGKYELKSKVLEKYQNFGLDALPTYKASLEEADNVQYPFVLTSGSRMPNVMHSRIHDLSWNRIQRPSPSADINQTDAARLKIKQSDDIEIATPRGTINVVANLTHTVLPGVVSMYHGYREADINSILSGELLDPYSGFPGYKTARCNIRKRG